MKLDEPTDLPKLADKLRNEAKTGKPVVIFGHNGTGKTRLSTEFKQIGKDRGDADTLYFNAYTEDLFTWNNDLDGDSDRFLNINRESLFSKKLGELKIEELIRPLLANHADFTFSIDIKKWRVTFSRNDRDCIKISRGEERIFIWCLFLAILKVALTETNRVHYGWVQHIYIDDPISSLDDENTVQAATSLAEILSAPGRQFPTVISTHHSLFFNVLCHSVKGARPFYLKVYPDTFLRSLNPIGKAPFFQHLTALEELRKAVKRRAIQRHHFGMLRSLLERTSNFLGYHDFSGCIEKSGDGVEFRSHMRLINERSHGYHAPFESRIVKGSDAAVFRDILGRLEGVLTFNAVTLPRNRKDP